MKYAEEYNSEKSLSLGDAVKIIAVLGGFKSGKNRVPGVQVMWRGIRRLEDVVLGILLVKGKHPKIPLRIFSDYG